MRNHEKGCDFIWDQQNTIGSMVTDISFADTPSIEVPTGEVKSNTHGILLISALGSCIAVAMIDEKLGIGGLAHIMLPGACPNRHKLEQTKYAEEGIRELIRSITNLGGRSERLFAAVVGGGNVLKRDNDTICEANIQSVRSILKRRSIPIKASQVGGTKRRSILVNMTAARITYTVGGSAPILLWQGSGSKTSNVSKI